jgi:hypothetical protein
MMIFIFALTALLTATFVSLRGALSLSSFKLRWVVRRSCFSSFERSPNAVLSSSDLSFSSCGSVIFWPFSLSRKIILSVYTFRTCRVDAFEWQNWQLTTILFTKLLATIHAKGCGGSLRKFLLRRNASKWMNIGCITGGHNSLSVNTAWKKKLLCVLLRNIVEPWNEVINSIVDIMGKCVASVPFTILCFTLRYWSDWSTGHAGGWCVVAEKNGCWTT